MAATTRQNQPRALLGLASSTVLDRELAELEKRKLVQLRGGTVTLTRAGYQEIVRRGLARGRR